MLFLLLLLNQNIPVFEAETLLLFHMLSHHLLQDLLSDSSAAYQALDFHAEGFTHRSSQCTSSLLTDFSAVLLSDVLLLSHLVTCALSIRIISG